VLDAAYEATLWAGVLNRARAGGSRDVFLTALGGGVFGNDTEWIGGAIGRAVARAHAACADINVRLIDQNTLPLECVDLPKRIERPRGLLLFGYGMPELARTSIHI
jgi:hypothetical protein